MTSLVREQKVSSSHALHSVRYHQYLDLRFVKISVNVGSGDLLTTNKLGMR